MIPVNILGIMPTQTDATSFYRGGGPLTHLKRSYNQNINLVPNYSWFTMGFSDVVFMQRPFRTNDVQIAEMAKSMGIPLWVDYDDDLFNVTSDNPAFETYWREDVQNNIRKIMQLCDFMTVSTDDLRRKAEINYKMQGKVMTINNAFNSHLIPKYEQPKRNKLITWRGSPTHHRDVTGYAQQIIELSQKYEEWTWEFIGDRLWFMTDGMPHKRTICVEAMDIIDYHKHLIQVAPSVMIVPLHDNTFNRSKSNIAWIEATYAGAVCVAPYWDEWVRPGCLNYEDQDHFQEIMENIMDGKEDLDALHKESLEEMLNKYDINYTNQQRLAILASLCPHKFPDLQKNS